MGRGDWSPPPDQTIGGIDVSTEKIADLCPTIARIQTELGRKFEVADVADDSDLLDIANRYARAYTGDFDYMLDMRATVLRRGCLSDGQAKGVLNCMAAAGRRAVRAESLPTLRVERMIPSGTYDAHGITLRVRLSDDGSAAVSTPDAASAWGWSRVAIIGPNHDVNPGWAATPDRLLAIRDLFSKAADLMVAATDYGKRTGRCGICGRELTDPASIAAGIGPICAGRLA